MWSDILKLDQSIIPIQKRGGCRQDMLSKSAIRRGYLS